MENINAFSYSKLKLMSEKPSKITSWLSILITLFIFFLLTGIFLNIKNYSIQIGYIENNNLRVIIDENFFPVKKNYKLYIDNKKYKYKILNIEKINNYYELVISCNLDKKLLINNNIIKIKFEKGKTTFLKYIIKKIKKGMV